MTRVILIIANSLVAATFVIALVRAALYAIDVPVWYWPTTVASLATMVGTVAYLTKGNRP